LEGLHFISSEFQAQAQSLQEKEKLQFILLKNAFISLGFFVHKFNTSCTFLGTSLEFLVSLFQSFHVLFQQLSFQ
jgi:hypothetical protein